MYKLKEKYLKDITLKITKEACMISSCKIVQYISKEKNV